MQSRAEGQAGFALLQAVAVVAILGAVAGVVLAVVHPQHPRPGFTATCSADVAAIRTAAESVRAVTSGYPDQTAQLFATRANPASNGALTRWPSMHGVTFLYTGDGPTYHLAVVGPGLRGVVLDQTSPPSLVVIACTRI